MSMVASAMLTSDLEKELLNKVESKAEEPPIQMKMTKRVSIKKVRLTPSKVLSMVKGDEKKKTPSRAPLSMGQGDAAVRSPEIVSGEEGGDEEEHPKTRKEQKKDVKEAIFGPGEFNPKIRKRGSSSENDSKKGKKTKRRRRKQKSVKPPPPPPKEKTPPPPPPPKEPTPKEPTPKEPTPKEPTPKEPTPEPPKEPTPPSPSPPPSPPPVSETKEPTPPSPPPIAVPPPPPAPIVPVSVPAEPESPGEEESNGQPSSTDDEFISESAYFESAKIHSAETRPKIKYGSLCCASKYKKSLRSRIRWLLVLLYRGPIKHTAANIVHLTPFNQFILGPTFDSILIEYVLLLLDAADKFIKGIFPELHLDKVEMAHLLKEVDTEPESGDK